MNQTLKNAMRQVEAEALNSIAVRKQIDAQLAASEANGGEIPHEDVVARMRARYAD